MLKKSFDIDLAVRRLRKAVERFPKAAMFQLYDEGHTSTFEQLVACIISIRTYDEVMLPTARKLFAQARTPAAMLRLSAQQIDELIRAAVPHAVRLATPQRLPYLTESQRPVNLR